MFVACEYSKIEYRVLTSQGNLEEYNGRMNNPARELDRIFIPCNMKAALLNNMVLTCIDFNFSSLAPTGLHFLLFTILLSSPY